MSLYEKDLSRWLLRQAEVIRARRWSQIEADVLAEEIEAYTRREYQQLRAAVLHLLVHILHRCHDSKYEGSAWESEAHEYRIQADVILGVSPSFRPRINRELPALYDRAVEIASGGDKRDRRLPRKCPYTLRQLIESGFLPMPPLGRGVRRSAATNPR